MCQMCRRKFSVFMRTYLSRVANVQINVFCVYAYLPLACAECADGRFLCLCVLYLRGVPDTQTHSFVCLCVPTFIICQICRLKFSLFLCTLPSTCAKCADGRFLCLRVCADMFVWFFVCLCGPWLHRVANKQTGFLLCLCVP